MPIIDLIVTSVTVITLVLLFLPKVRSSLLWRATVTPLASIIGSGFLIIAPVLGQAVGPLAGWAMLGIVCFAFLIGHVIRFNIRYGEPLLEKAKGHGWVFRAEQLSNAAVFFAYLISVAFYLRLLSSYALKLFDHSSDFSANLLTTAILGSIAVVGVLKGLRFLEALEKFSVSIKLSIIAALLAGLLFFDIENGQKLPDLISKDVDWHMFGLLAGMLLVVQGFETSRYLGDEYSASDRVRSMRIAQILSGLVYVGFVVLVMPLLGLLENKTADETAIIQLSGHVADTLPYLLILAALASQFSAAIADTLGGGGLIREETRGNVSSKVGYLIITAGACLLIWIANIFEIVAFASRAFAFYYLTQTLVALVVVYRSKEVSHKPYRYTFFTVMICILAWIVIFAIPVE
ncbi:hypothetical protein [Sneathiella limimaris]|uniref:hypothetical protein n=1 Tax=Sneathiella limimaris TaxID=1964213 RepID=UPI00146A44C6|nr:hypothetical protein [Sneathiella limimaris]